MTHKNVKKILIIAPTAFGYTAHIQKALKTYNTVESSICYLDQPAFKYKNGLHKAKNFVCKLFGKNLKKTFVFDRIRQEVSQLEKQDVIFIIRPDVLDDNTLTFLKAKTHQFVAYYYDSTRRFKRKIDIISFFDVIYSYDLLDVETYNFKFLTNYIYEESRVDKYKHLFFNISTNDYRFPFTEALATYLKQKKWSYNIQVYNRSEMPSKHVKIITKQQSIAEVSQLIQASKIIVEIQREEQVGLSFRIFEALGHGKKLVTTNKDIVNYDFYNPQNILVVDTDNMSIPETFVTSSYVPVAENILNHYRIKNWVRRVFDL